ncbi:elongation of very long chain fatty acids protein 1-like [Topomyia yanbarensis]|uniref:elongation of very long chain fatty acids protein 1-like n=1 Tax=Topomyia yanbarensis TaxID=2498891 RepID=UPI00273C7301|nr:elongation of very long chain fatty acids protein 1-like [Topomyia yanbarensis]
MDSANITSHWLQNVNGLGGMYNFLVYDLADHRTKDLPLLHNPIWIVSCLVTYLLLVLHIVPKWMEDRKPFRLREISIIYDAFQIIGSGTSIYLFFKHGWSWDFFWECKAPDFSNDVHSIGFARAAYFTYLLKMTELIETVMYALRKKNNQISFFHVYHHCYAVITSHGFAKYGGGSMLSYTIIVNSIVHVFMYTYYLSSIFAKQLPFSLVPMKKVITVLQIVQLASVLVNLCYALSATCPVPVLHCLFHGPNMALQIKLFADFYATAYKSKTPVAKLTDSTEAITDSTQLVHKQKQM